MVRQLARTQSIRRRLGIRSVTLARSRVRVRAGYEFVSCRHHPRSKASCRTNRHSVFKTQDFRGGGGLLPVFRRAPGTPASYASVYKRATSVASSVVSLSTQQPHTLTEFCRKWHPSEFEVATAQCADYSTLAFWSSTASTSVTVLQVLSPRSSGLRLDW